MGTRQQEKTARTNDPGNAALDEARRIVDGVTELDARTVAIVDAAERHINGLMNEVGNKYAAIAEYVVEKVFDGDTLSALFPNKAPPAAWVVLLGRAEDTLVMPRNKLVQATRIGALNRHLSGTPWKGLSWSAKQDLLPLVGGDGDLAVLKEGARAAAKGLGVRAVRDWVAKKTVGDPPAVDGTEQPVVPNVSASRKAFDLAACFARAQERRAWLLKVDKLGTKERDTLFASLKSASKHLAKLLAEFEASMQEA